MTIGRHNFNASILSNDCCVQSLLGLYSKYDIVLREWSFFLRVGRQESMVTDHGDHPIIIWIQEIWAKSKPLYLRSWRSLSRTWRLQSDAWIRRKGPVSIIFHLKILEFLQRILLSWRKFYWTIIYIISLLTPKHREKHECVASTVATDALVRSQHCGYWCPGAKAPCQQHPQCWLNIQYANHWHDNGLLTKGYVE